MEASLSPLFSNSVVEYTGISDLNPNQHFDITIDLSRDDNFGVVSRTLFKDGKYMLPAETSLQYALARAACAYASNADHAQRLYDYVSKKWFMFASPVLASAGNPRGCPVSCFAAGTPVLTKSGFKEIDKLVVGDMVKTRGGTFEKVLATKESESSDLYKVRVDKRRTTLVVTGNHLLLTNEGWVRVDQLVANYHYIACDEQIFLEEKPHTITITNPFKQGGGRFERNEVVQEVEVTEELAWALGLWFAEGSTGERSVRLTNNSGDVCQKWCDIMQKYFGVKGNVYASRTWSNADISSTTLAEWFDKEFGKGCKNKVLTDWIVELPKPHLEKFYEGLYLGDGSKTTAFEALEMSNPKLVAGVHNILLKLGRQHSLRLDKNTASGNKSGIIIMKREFTRRRSGLKFHDGLYYNPLLEVEKLSETKKVYDIQVENDPSFVAAGVVAHNCFLSDVQDDRGDIAASWEELLWMSTEGGGAGQNWSKIRSNGERTSRGTSTPGLIPFLHVVDSIIISSIQGEVRRGAVAIYLDVTHPELMEFLDARKPSAGGDPHRKILNTHYGVNIPDSFMKAVEAGDMWDFIDPHSGKVKHSLPAREVWDRILTLRLETGEPYLHFSDTSNRHLPKHLKNIGLSVNNSNLCVAPETLLLTKEYGERPIAVLEGVEVSVWNGEFWSKTRVARTSDSSPLIEVRLKSLDCHDSYVERSLWTTEYHKFFIEDGTKVKACELTAGTKLQPFTNAKGEVENWEVIHVDKTPTRVSPTYCVYEPLANKAVFNGILTGNCSEIMLPTSSTRSAVCVLSSVNLEFFDEWSQVPEFVGDLVEMLDNVLDAFIRKAPEQLGKAIHSARQERSIGLGAMGFHSYLQSKSVPFESAIASSLNRRMFSYIKTKATEASYRLGAEKGEAPDIQSNLKFWSATTPDTFWLARSSDFLRTSRGIVRAFELKEGDVVDDFDGEVIASIEGKHEFTGRRCSHLLAIAPNASSATLCDNPSPSIEPINANVFNQKTSNGVFPIRNKYLNELLKTKYGKTSKEALDAAWTEILLAGGSIQNFDWIEQADKEVFKTAIELDQNWIIEHAAVRQEYICQGQSVNLFVPNDVKMSFLRALHKSAWKKGLKSLYYVRSQASGKLKTPEVMEMETKRAENAGCLSCEG